LSIGVHIPFAGEQVELGFGEVRVDHGERDAVKGQIPPSIPGIFPLVGHGEYIEVIEVFPAEVTPIPAVGWRRRCCWVTIKPLLHIVIKQLL
jgi:hypothetical protein